MKTTKQTFAMLLALALLLCASPVGILAASDKSYTDTGQKNPPATGSDLVVITDDQEARAGEQSAIVAEDIAPSPSDLAEPPAETINPRTTAKPDEPKIPNEYAEMDFSSRRILVSGSEDDLIDSAAVLASYEDVTLLQFDSEADAMEAYAHYAESDAAVEVDAAVVVADDVTAIEDADIVSVEMNADTNPLTALNEILEESAAPVSSKHTKLIAVIDTGASSSGNVLKRYSVLGGAPGDDNGHGMAMIRAITSVNPDAAIISIKALDADGHGSISALYAAIQLAMELDVDIINLSVYANKTDESTIVTRAIEDADAAGIRVIGAAGNSGSDASGYVPGCVDRAIIAGALTSGRKLQPFSNFGETVDYYVVSASTSEAAALVTGYYSKADAEFSNIVSDVVFTLPNNSTVTNYAALNTSDFVIAWTGWPITVTEVFGTPVGIKSGSRLYFGVPATFYTHQFYAMFNGQVSDYTGPESASAFAYCVDSIDNSSSYDAGHLYEIDITSYPTLCAAVITAPTARTMNSADEIFSEMGIDLNEIWSPLNNTCFQWLDKDGSAHALLCNLFHSTWDFNPMNWGSAQMSQEIAALDQIAENLGSTFQPGTAAYRKLVSNFRVFVAAEASDVSTHQRFIFSLGEDSPGGGLNIVKTSDDGNVSGITFTVKNNDTGDTQSVVTGTDGTFLMEGLTAGSYTVTETVPTEYVSDNSSQTVTVTDGETANVNFSNTLKKFRVQLTKVDDDSGSTIAGAVYGLYQDGTEVDRYTTDANGKFTTDYYTCGTGWTLKEITPPSGYTLDSTVYTVSAAPGTFTAARNTVETTVREKAITGRISITKKATNSVAGTKSNENGAIFVVYLKSAGSYARAAASERDILVINNNGTATSKELPYGVYIVKQTYGWTGFRLDDTEYEFSITTNGQTVSLELENEIFKGTLRIVKREANTALPLSGARFQVKNSTGRVVADKTTGANGIITVENLTYGSYTYQEVDAPEGYQLDENVYSFSITSDGQTVEHTRDNRFMLGSISVLKTDADGNPLSGVVYKLEYSTNNGRTWTPVFSQTGDNATAGSCTSSGLSGGKLTTGRDGTVKFDGLLANGKVLYRLTEVAARDGHTLLKDPVYVGTLPADGDSEPVCDISATIRDGAVFGLPMTGANGFAPQTMGALLLLPCFSLLYGVIRRKNLFIKENIA